MISLDPSKGIKLADHFRTDTTSRLDGDTPPAPGFQLLQKLRTLKAGILLSGGKDGIDSQRNCLFHSLDRVCAHIKSPVQRNRHISRRIHQFLHLFHIQGTIRFQDTYYDTLRSHFAEILYCIPYHGKFCLCITEISKTRTDQRMDPDIRTLPYFLKKPRAGSCSPDDQIAAKLQSVRATLGCCHGRFHRIHAGFQNIVFHVKIPLCYRLLRVISLRHSSVCSQWYHPEIHR